MALLDCPRHFVLLVGATAALAPGLTVQTPWSPAAERLFVSVLWWLGFSISPYIADRRRPASGAGS